MELPKRDPDGLMGFNDTLSVSSCTSIITSLHTYWEGRGGWGRGVERGVRGGGRRASRCWWG